MHVTLLDLDAKLAEVLLVPHVLVGVLDLVEGEDLLVDDGLDVVGLDGAVHLLELQPVADEDAADGARLWCQSNVTVCCRLLQREGRNLPNVVQAVQESRLVLTLDAADEADDGNHAVDRNGLQTLRHGVGTADFEDVLHAAAAGRELLRLLAPVADFLVVDHVVRSESLELLALRGRGSGGDDLGASGLGELHGENAHAASALGQNIVAGLHSAALEAVQTVPRGEGRAGEGGALQEVEVGGHVDKALLVVGAVLAQRAVENSADASGHAVAVQRAAQVALVEEGQDFVALLEAVNA